jgi:hypothetical protein
MAKYRKKPVVIEAVKWTGKNKEDICRFTEDKCYFQEGMFIKTLEGDMFAHVGDYIIKGVQGEFYPCKPDIFEETYEIVEE